jgi:cellulose synthase (UDP-forming)
MVLAAPMVYWMTGTPVIDTHIDALVYYQLPFTIGICMMMFVLSERRAVPILSDIGQMISSFVIMRAVAVALVKPWGHPFKVTPKGKSTDRVVIHWFLAWPFLLLAGGIVLGLAANVSPYSPVNGLPGYDINVVWSLVDIVLLLITAAACVELPRSGVAGFPTRENATLVCGECRLPCVVTNLAVEGAEVTAYDRELAQTATVLLLDGGALEIPIRCVRARPRALDLEFALEAESRRAMIRKLFGGSYDVEVERIAVGVVIWSMCKRMLR